MVSACAYSGAYPTGYGRYTKGTEGVPEEMFDRLQASGFTHFQQSGTGAIRKYYNYVRVTPMVQTLDALGDAWELRDECASAGYYAATLENGIRCEITVGEKVAVHRYTFPEHRRRPDRRRPLLRRPRHPARAHRAAAGERREPRTRPAQGTVVLEGVPLSVHLEVLSPGWRQMLWHDRRLIEGGTQLAFDSIRPTTLRPFGLLFMGPAVPGRRSRSGSGSPCGAASRRATTCAGSARTTMPAFERVRLRTAERWADHVDRVHVDGGTPARRQVMATALYHSLIKPCFADDESPFWPSSGPFVFDICTMWDIYKTQFPLLTAIVPNRAVDLLESLIRVCEEEGNFPIGYRMAHGADRFFRQASALAHTALADVNALGFGDLDWGWALVHMEDDLRRMYGEDFIEHGIVHPITHTLDLAYAHHCTAKVARAVGDVRLAEELAARGRRWVNAFEPDSGLLRDSEFYEGGKWNYSFRILHDMAGPDRPRRRRRRLRPHARRVLRLRGGSGEAGRARAPSPRRWPPATP